MKRYRIFPKLLKNLILIFLFFPETIWAQYYVYCDVTYFENKLITLNRYGGDCDLNFVTKWHGENARQQFVKEMISALDKNHVDWVSLVEVRLGSYNGIDQTGIMTIRVANNTTGKERSVLISGQGGGAFIEQKGPDPNEIKIYTAFNDYGTDNAFPGRKHRVTLKGSEKGVLYVLDKDTLVGTGDPLVFETDHLTEGLLYHVTAIKGGRTAPMEGDIYFNYYDFLKAGFCTQEEISQLQGYLGMKGCYYYAYTLPFYASMPPQGLVELDDMLQQINDGKSVNYPGLYLERKNDKIWIENGPNIRGVYWPCELYFALENKSGGKTCKLTYYPYTARAPILVYNLELREYLGPDDFTLGLESYQLAIKYKLFRDGVFVQEKRGTLYDMPLFEHLSGKGTYYVEAHYCDTVVRMNGSVYIDGETGVTSYVKENNYYREDNPVGTYVYYDGLGREIQTRIANAGSNNNDIITFREYDNLGRERKIYLPYDKLTSGPRLHPKAEQDAFYLKHYGTYHYAWSERVFENSPQERIIESSSPGYETRLSSRHTRKNNVRKNPATEKVKHYKLNGSSVTLAGFYGVRSLLVSVTTDEDGQVLSEYKDVEENVICKSQAGLSTYYIYDEIGKLRYILPPFQDSLFASGSRSLAELSDYCYYMEYDNLGRLYKQYIPGAGYTIYLYDKRDRKVFVQDAKMRSVNQWHFTKYDGLNRPVIEGICIGTEAQLADMLATQEVFEEERGEVLHGYTNGCPPVDVTDSDCMNITYYDNYTWTGQETVEFSLADTLGVDRNDRVEGQVTGLKTKVLGNPSDQWLITAHYYDRYYQTIQTVSQLYPSGMEIVSNHHDFGGKVDRVKVKQVIGDQVTEYTKYMDYDRHGRLLSIQQKISGDEENGKVALSMMEYGNLGRLTKEKLHNGRDSLTYSYDLRGRLTGYHSPYFSYELGIEKVDPDFYGLVNYRYNGLITHMKWANGLVPDKGYSYSYDKLGQLKGAIPLLKGEDKWGMSIHYIEGNSEYDPNGNLKRLIRYDGSGKLLHDIEYNYACSGNRNAISSVKVNEVTSGNYVYDANGNLTEDGFRGTHITYNELNLPLSISCGTENVLYIYNARGEKLEERVGSSSTYYRDVMVYNGNNLSYIRHPKGVIRKVNNNYVYDYFITDHLGSTRVVLEASGNELTPVQQTGYYPSGLSYSYNDLHRNKYLFSGKEVQDVSLGGELLGLYDFGSRFYDPVIGRWFCQDPALQLVNPYAFCGNNPVCFVDPDGEFIFAAILIGVAISVAIDYAVQVAVNYVSGYHGADAWFRKVDFFDVAVSGVIGGVTAGYGAAASTGHKIGQAGSFLMKHPKLLAVGETALTSTIDITGEGWQEVSFQQVGTRLVSAGLTYAARMGLQKAFKNKPVPENAAFSNTETDPYSFTVGEAKFTTSSRSVKPSRNYSIYDDEGNILKFGVSDANFKRMNQSLRDAGKGAYAKYSGIIPKWQAHLNEKYMRSLFYNSTRVYYMPRMKIPYPIDFNTGEIVRSPLK